MIRTQTVAVSALLLAACAVPQAVHGQEAAPAPYAGIDLAAYLDCARTQRVTLLQAHRAGDRPGAAENSLAALNASLRDGAVFIEIDVARTADGVLILMHDDTLDRTTTGSGPIDGLTFAALADLELVDVDGQPTGETVPTLADALAALDGRGIAQIDRKRPTRFEEIADVLEAEGAADRAVVITYTLEDAIALHQRLPDVMISVGLRDQGDVQTLTDAGVDLTRIQAWLGLGAGNPDWDAELTRLGIETSYGDFRGERNGTADYALMARNGAEVISVDDVPAAAAALDAAATADALLAACPAARP